MSNSVAEKHQELVSKGSQLCVSCGLCCKGVLHSHAVLAPDEIELTARLRIPLYPQELAYDAFALPCPCHQDGKCSVYLDRPKVCVDYQCELLKAFLQGTLSFEESADLVKKATGLVDAIEQHIQTGDPSRRIWQNIKNFLERQPESSLEDEKFRQTNAKFLMDVKMLSIMLGRYFESYNFESRTFRSEPATP